MKKGTDRTMSDKHMEKSADKKGDPRERSPQGNIGEEKRDRIYDDLLAKVTELVDISPTDIHPQMDVDMDLGMDSLRIYEMVIALEGMYDIRLMDEDLEKVHTIADFVELIYTITEKS